MKINPLKLKQRIESGEVEATEALKELCDIAEELRLRIRALNEAEQVQKIEVTHYDGSGSRGFLDDYLF